MTAIRSLSSGVTGMLFNQLSMDITANNLANINTPGFKGSRVSFANSLVQTLFNGSAPGTNIGGRNPRQVGLGVTTSSIDIDMRQGALNATGRDLDLAIQGDGFFEVTDGLRSFYTRVGAFGLDSDNFLVHNGTGYRVIGNTYNLDLQPDGSQTVNQIGVPLEMPLGTSFPPKRTEEIIFQGNLSSNLGALRGSQLQSVFPVKSTLTGRAATEDTPMSELNIFKGGAMPAAPADRLKTIYVFGTKPNGETFGGSFTVNPWAEVTAEDRSGTLGNLMSKVNDCMVHGSSRFGTLRLESGNMIATGVGAGDGFSLFIGETNPFPNAGPAVAALGSGSVAYTGTPITDRTTPAQHTFAAPDEPGLMRTTFRLPVRDYTAQGDVTLRLTMLKGDIEIGSMIIPSDYSTRFADQIVTDGTGRQWVEFKLPAYPHVALDDKISYTFSGSLNLADGDGDGVNDITDGTDQVQWETNVSSDLDIGNITQDRDTDGIADMFEENQGTGADVNAWVYKENTNANFNWYRARFVPGTVSSSIEIFDAQGGRHTVETRFLRAGTRTDPSTNARINSWDMLINVPQTQGNMVADVIAGIEFDQLGRFTGSIGTTIQGTTLNAFDYVGSPASQTVQVDWNSTGITDPATIRMNFGNNNSFDGLTGFGSDSNATAVAQNGYSSGELDTLSVSTEGDMVALYTNGVSRKLAQLTLVVFRNPTGLASIEGNLWRQTTNSGNPTRRVAGENAGLVSAGALESSNVDIATEFSNLITAQRGFQVSARIIQTSDQILEELANLIR